MFRSSRLGFLDIFKFTCTKAKKSLFHLKTMEISQKKKCFQKRELGFAHQKEEEEECPNGQKCFIERQFTILMAYSCFVAMCLTSLTEANAPLPREPKPMTSKSSKETRRIIDLLQLVICVLSLIFLLIWNQLLKAKWKECFKSDSKLTRENLSRLFDCQSQEFPFYIQTKKCSFSASFYLHFSLFLFMASFPLHYL